MQHIFIHEWSSIDFRASLVGLHFILHFFCFLPFFACNLSTLFCRTRTVAPVQDIVATVVNERDLLFVLHSDGHLRIWDSHMKLLNYNVCSNDIEGNAYVLFTSILLIRSFWTGDHCVMVMFKQRCCINTCNVCCASHHHNLKFVLLPVSYPSCWHSTSMLVTRQLITFFVVGWW